MPLNWAPWPQDIVILHNSIQIWDNALVFLLSTTYIKPSPIHINTTFSTDYKLHRDSLKSIVAPSGLKDFMEVKSMNSLNLLTYADLLKPGAKSDGLKDFKKSGRLSY